MKEKFPKIIKEVVIETVCRIFSLIAALAVLVLLVVVLSGIAGTILSIITGPNWPIVLVSAIVVISIFIAEWMKYRDETNNKH